MLNVYCTNKFPCDFSSKKMKIQPRLYRAVLTNIKQDIQHIKKKLDTLENLTETYINETIEVNEEQDLVKTVELINDEEDF